MEAVSTQKLKQDLRAVVVDAEDLLKATASQTGERVDKIRAHAEESLRQARVRLGESGEALGQQARAAALGVDDLARRQPWAAAGIAAGVGLLVGLLISRR
jgi:ElaB/YqjD/DUF883 family membrane-anchored ribosome-binding protein